MKPYCSITELVDVWSVGIIILYTILIIVVALVKSGMIVATVTHVRLHDYILCMLFASDAAIGYECRDFSVVPMDMK